MRKATTSTRWSPTCLPIGWADATPAPGWTIAHQIAHLLWTDRVALTAVTDEAGFAAVLAEAAKDPTGIRRRRRRGVRRAARPTVCWPTGAQTRDSSARRTAGRRRRPQAAVVRSADERRVDGHRPADGDLGARSGRRRHARGEAARDGAAAFDRAHRRAHPRLRVLHQRAHSPGGAVPRGAARARRLDLGVGSRRRRAARHGFGRGLLHAGHPATAAGGPGRRTPSVPTPSSGWASRRRSRVRRGQVASGTPVKLDTRTSARSRMACRTGLGFWSNTEPQGHTLRRRPTAGPTSTRRCPSRRCKAGCRRG